MSPIAVAIVRLIAPFYGMLNLILVAYGLNPMPFTEEEVTIAVSSVITFAGTLYVWWKNAAITKEAQQAQFFLEELKEKNGK